MTDRRKPARWSTPVSFLAMTLAFVGLYVAVEGRPPDLATCAKASIVVAVTGSLLSAVIRAIRG